VEILCKPGHFEHDNPEDISEVQAAVGDWPGGVVTFHAPFYDVDLASSDAGTRGGAVKESLKALDVAYTLGARNVTVHVRSNPGMRERGAPNFEAFRGSLNELMQVAADRSISLSVENFPPPCFTALEDDLLHLLEDFPVRLVGACIDTGHAHLGGRGVQLAHALASRASAIHLHDNNAQGRDEHLIPGMGTIHWQDVVRALETGGFRGHLVAEVMMVESLAKTLDTLKRAIMGTGLSRLGRS